MASSSLEKSEYFEGYELPKKPKRRPWWLVLPAALLLAAGIVAGTLGSRALERDGGNASVTSPGIETPTAPPTATEEPVLLPNTGQGGRAAGR